MSIIENVAVLFIHFRMNSRIVMIIVIIILIIIVMMVLII